MNLISLLSTDEEKNKEAMSILKELESIDDECDSINVDFVKISDPGVATNFKLPSVPALVYFRRTVPIRYEGDLMDEEVVLNWVTTTKQQDIDVIEEVDMPTLEKMIKDKSSVVVYFCKSFFFSSFHLFLNSKINSKLVSN